MRTPVCDQKGVGFMDIFLIADDPDALIRAAQTALSRDDCATAQALVAEAFRAVAARNRGHRS